MDFTTVLGAIAQAAPIINSAPALLHLFGDVIESFDDVDQAELKEALADARAENDEGHTRLQAKLAAAAKR